jgi:hypothetical protein
VILEMWIGGLNDNLIYEFAQLGLLLGRSKAQIRKKKKVVNRE